MLGRTSLVMDTDERGCLVTFDQDRFVVLEVNGKYLLVPKARVDAVVEVD